MSDGDRSHVRRGGQPAGNSGYTWFPDPHLCLHSYFVLGTSAPECETPQRNRSRTRPFTLRTTDEVGKHGRPPRLHLEAFIRHISYPSPGFSAPPQPRVSVGKGLQSRGPCSGISGSHEPYRCSRPRDATGICLVSAAWDRGGCGGRRICTQYTQVSWVPRSGPSGTRRPHFGSSKSRRLLLCPGVTASLPPTFLPRRTREDAGPIVADHPRRVTTRRTMIRTRGRLRESSPRLSIFL